MIILVKYGEIILKGLNRPIFEDALVRNIRKSLSATANVYKSMATVYVEPEDDSSVSALIEDLRHVCGVVSICPAYTCGKDIESILGCAADNIKIYGTFKVESRRADKTFPIKSPQLSALVGEALLNANPGVTVDVSNPETIVNVEVRDKAVYVYSGKIKGVGGLPAGTNGTGTLMLSGGIDSPVAGYMLAKRGMNLKCVHFASPPYTSDGAQEKVITLAKILARYTGGLTLTVVPFTDIQLAIRDNCPPEYLTVIMRRIMMKITAAFANNEGAIITGESLGQVASQTAEALNCTGSATSMQIFRPLIGLDKDEIVGIARKIGTFETSILPFEDCCTVFVPKHPATKPKLKYILHAEESLTNIIELTDKAIAGSVHYNI